MCDLLCYQHRMPALDDLRASFARATAAGESCDVARGALVIARIAYPELDPGPALAALDALAAGLRPRLDARAPLAERAAMLAHYLFEERGYHGNRDDYYDPRNSFLNDVLERRMGIPITLAVVLIEVGARVGITLEGVGFPGHFLVRVAGDTGSLLLDPFFAGRPIGHAELLERLRAFYSAGGGPTGGNLQRALPQALQTTGSLGILTRMLGNLLAIYREREAHEEALATVELLLVLWPDAPEHLRIRGLLYEQLECFSSALADFRRYLTLAPETHPAAEVREHLHRLERVTTTLH
jgi:regulator of sirC expression with transglutaminase-like and TPR domain